MLIFIQPVGQGRRRRLVDDALDVQPGDLAGVLGGLALAVREISGNGNHGLRDLFAQICLGVRLQLLKHHGADLLGRICLAVNRHLVAGPHFTLNGADGAVGVGDGLTSGDLTDHTLAGFRKRYHGRRCARAFGVGNDDSLAAFHNGHTGIGGAQIDAYYFTHYILSSIRLK